MPQTRALVGLLWVVMGAACAHTPPGAPPSSPSVLLGKPSPRFKRPTVQGPMYDTEGAHTRAPFLVFDFFAAYCQPCQRTLPVLQALRAKRPDLEIVGISLDDRPEGAMRMVNRHRLTFPVVHDSDHILAGRFRVTEVPMSFIADASGRIIWTGDSTQPDDALPRAIAALTSKP